MAQGYDKTYPPTTGGDYVTFASLMRQNQSAINTAHKGGTAPTNPENGQSWIDDTATPWTLKFYDGVSASWKVAGQIIIQFKEIVDARGSAASVDARISAALNPDGTLKASTTLSPSEWLLVTGMPTRITASQFKIGTTDLTAIFQANRRVMMTPGAYGTVLSSSFGAGTTTVNLIEATVPIEISAVSVCIISAAAATAALNAKSIPSPSGGAVEDYLADQVLARRGLAGLFQDFDQDNATTTALTWGYKSGILPMGTVKVAGTLALTADSFNYVELNLATGLISANTSGFTAGRVPLRKITTNLSNITVSVDARPWFFNPSVDLTGGLVPYNYLRNGNFEIWNAGASAVPDNWTKVGAGSSVAKDNTNFKLGASAAALTRLGADCYLAQTPNTTEYGPAAWWQGKTVTFGCWVRATVANRARLTLNDGVGTTIGASHTGGSTFEFLTVTRTLDAAATKVEVRCQIDTGDTTAQFDGCTLIVGSSLVDFIPSGSVLESGIWTNNLGPTGSNTRIAGTIYQNTSGRMRRTSIVVQATAGASPDPTVIVDILNPPTAYHAEQLTQANGIVTVSPMIPNGFFYKITLPANNSIVSWKELDE